MLITQFRFCPSLTEGLLLLLISRSPLQQAAMVNVRVVWRMQGAPVPASKDAYQSGSFTLRFAGCLGCASQGPRELATANALVETGNTFWCDVLASANILDTVQHALFAPSVNRRSIPTDEPLEFIQCYGYNRHADYSRPVRVRIAFHHAIIRSMGGLEVLPVSSRVGQMSRESRSKTVLSHAKRET